MGFISGFTGGVTLTLGLAYLTVLQHERNRTSQALHLRTQSHLLNSLLEPPQQQPLPLTRAEIARQERSTITERAKDRWNEEIEKSVRFIQTTDWNGVREGLEEKVAALLGRGLEKSRDGIEEGERRAKPLYDDAVQKGQDGVQRAKDEGFRVVNDAAKGSIRGAEEAKAYADVAAGKAKAGLDKAGLKAGETAEAARNAGSKAFGDAKAKTHEAEASAKNAWSKGAEKTAETVDKTKTTVASAGPGTVDTIRNSVRKTVTKGIEKGKELVGKAQETVGVASEKVGSAIGSTTSTLSPEEKALRQRYEKSHSLDQTVEEALAARYTPIDERDNSVLRGV